VCNSISIRFITKLLQRQRHVAIFLLDLNAEFFIIFIYKSIESIKTRH